MFHWMTAPVFDGQDGHFPEVVLRQLYLAVEDGHQVFGLDPLGLRVGAVALQAQIVFRRGPQQLRILAAVRLVTGRAALLKRWLMQMLFIAQARLISVAA